MNSELLKTLDQVQDAIDAVEKQRRATDLTKAEKTALEATTMALTKVQRSIRKKMTEQLYASLKQDVKPLKGIIADLKAETERLKKVAKVVQKATDAVNAVIRMAAIAAEAGLV